MWKTLYDGASTGRRPAGMTLRQFLDEGLAFIGYLETHHNIEETYIFPVLAKRMPEFQSAASAGTKSSNKKAAELLQQHREIHKGMDVTEAYLRQCRTGETDLEMGVLKAKLDSWGAVLWKHLDQEVAALGAENVRKYWTIEEIRKIPM